MADNEEKLVKMLKYVSEHNDFYKNRIKEYGIRNPLDITQWPVLTRKELQENRYNMFSDGYKSKYFNQQLRRQSSSGSTGMPVNVYWDYKDWYASNMCLWRKRHEWYGINPSDKYCVFTLNAFGITPEKDKLYYINEPKNILSFNVSLIRDEHGYEQMAEIINKFRPDWLYIQPFVLNHLICAYENLGIEPAKTVRYIESVGEILTSDLRRRTEEMFNIRITNMYGSEEMNGIAYECPNGHMHMLLDNIFLEPKFIIGNNGQNQLILTNLNNRAMPLINYAQDDLVLLGKTTCEYDFDSIIIDKIFGRIYESIKIDDFEINDLTLKEIIFEINNEFNDAILEYKFEFNKQNRMFSCYIKLRDESICWFNSIKNAMKKVFVHKVPYKEIGFSVIYLERFAYSNSKQTIKIIEE